MDPITSCPGHPSTSPGGPILLQASPWHLLRRRRGADPTDPYALASTYKEIQRSRSAAARGSPII